MARNFRNLVVSARNKVMLSERRELTAYSNTRFDRIPAKFHIQNNCLEGSDRWSTCKRCGDSTTGRPDEFLDIRSRLGTGSLKIGARATILETVLASWGRMYKNISLLVLLFLLPAVAWGQSLGDAARKERERREKNKKQGVVAREFSEEEIFRGDEENQEGTDLAEGEDAVEGEAADGEQQGPPAVPSINLDSKSQESEELEDDRRDRRREEAEWRGRFQRAKRTNRGRAGASAVSGGPQSHAR